MPFKSEAQRRYLWKNEPEIARKWTDERKRSALKLAAKSRLKKSTVGKK